MENRNCQNCKKDFVIEPDDFLFYEKIKVPPPTLCPLCRQKRRLFVRNFRTLYRRTSSKSGIPMISMYHEKQPFPVWTTEEWYQDDWDAIDYGRDYDFSRPFFEQYKELLDTVPHYGLMVNNSPDCSYCNLCDRSSRCYFVFGCVDNEDCDYGHSIWNCRDSVDCLYLFKSEYCYQCVDVLESSRLAYCQECEACTDSIALFDCRGCINCIGCVGLRNKSYHIFNQPVSKETYAQFLVDHPLNDPATLEYIFSETQKLHKIIPVPQLFGSHNVDVSGNHVYHAKNVHWGFDIKSGENSKFGFTVRKMVNSYDCGFSLNIENNYESLFSQPYGLRFCHLAVDCTDSEYAQFCFNSNNVFGCVGLRKKDYCILNKQYTKEQYIELREKIIEHMKKTGEWGEFFPTTLAPFAYNESTVGEYYPLTREQALTQGYLWKDDIPEMRGQENAHMSDFTGSDQYDFSKIKESIFACASCSRNYRLIEHEVTFYKRFGLSLPVQCFFCRHQARMDMRMPRQLFERSCACDKTNHDHDDHCQKQFQTNYSPDRSEIVYCESCYQKEVL